MSGSVLPVFHQEMVVYSLKPSFDYQEAAYKVHVWKKDRDKSKSRKPRRKFNFKQIARYEYFSLFFVMWFIWVLEVYEFRLTSRLQMFLCNRVDISSYMKHLATYFLRKKDVFGYG